MLWSLFAIFYSTVALFGILMTLGESLQSTRPQQPLMTALGILSCVIWPLMLVAMAISARRPSARLIQE